MPRLVISSARRFQIWEYTVSHSQLLLRSTKSAEFPTRIDVFFKNVKEIHLPTAFTGLVIEDDPHGNNPKLVALKADAGNKKDLKVFSLKGEDFIGHVIAGAVFGHEDDGEYYDPSFFVKNNIL